MTDLDNTLALPLIELATPGAIVIVEESKQNVCIAIDIILDVFLINKHYTSYYTS